MVCGSGALASSPPPPPIRASSQASWAAGASALSWADAPPDGCGEVQSREGRAEARVQAAGGCGGMHPIDTHTRWSKRPHLQKVRFSAYKTLFEGTNAYQPIKSQSPRVSHDEQYLSHFASLQILLACSIENLLDNPSSIPGRAQKVF